MGWSRQSIHRVADLDSSAKKAPKSVCSPGELAAKSFHYRERIFIAHCLVTEHQPYMQIVPGSIARDSLPGTPESCCRSVQIVLGQLEQWLDSSRQLPRLLRI